MGIRVNKFLGYGLTDVQSGDYRIADPRINNDSPLLDFEYGFSGQDVEEQLDAYAAWLADNSREMHEFEDGERHSTSFDLGCLRHRHEERARYRGRRDLGDCCVWQGEFGLENVLVLQPWGCADWRRHDDMIDWIEESYLRRPDSQHPQIDHVEVLRYGIYPWTGAMDKRTGERLRGKAESWVRVFNFMRDDPEYAARVTDSELELLAKAAGFDSHEQASENVVPAVPGEVYDLARYANLFTADDVWLQLRPMIYTYWA